jgi:hypothetical protein
MMESTETALDLRVHCVALTDSRLNPVRTVTPGPGPQPDSASAELTQAKAGQVSVWTFRGLCGRGTGAVDWTEPRELGSIWLSASTASG